MLAEITGRAGEDGVEVLAAGAAGRIGITVGGGVEDCVVACVTDATGRGAAGTDGGGTAAGAAGSADGFVAGGATAAGLLTAAGGAATVFSTTGGVTPASGEAGGVTRGGFGSFARAFSAHFSMGS